MILKVSNERFNMCNRLHVDSRPIPESGEGWKIFGVSVNSELSSLFKGDRYLKENDGFVLWKNQFGDGQEQNGFCFLLSEKEAIRLYKDLSYVCSLVLKINYRKGLAKHMQKGIVAGYEFETALCKEFSVVDDRYTL